MGVGSLELTSVVDRIASTKNRMSTSPCGQWLRSFGVRFRIAEDVWTQFAARNLSVAFLIQAPRQRTIEVRLGAERLTEVADRGAAALRVCGLFGRRQRVEVLTKRFHAAILPLSNSRSIPFGHVPAGN